MSVDESQLGRFVLSVVQEEIDLCKITGSYGSERGQPPFNPVMMTALLLYACCSSIYSSRRIAKFRQFLLRGIEKVRAEWALVCTAHNLCKLAQRWSLSTASLKAAGAT